MVNTSVYGGALGAPDANSDGVFDLPQLANLVSGFKISRLSITGYSGAGNDLFVNTNIGCDYIGTASLRNALLDNTRTVDNQTEDLGVFGIAARTIKRLKLRQQDGANYTWPNNWLADPMDLTIRVV